MGFSGCFLLVLFVYLFIVILLGSRLVSSLGYYDVDVLGSFYASEDGLVVGEDEGDRVGIPLGYSLGR